VPVLQTLGLLLAVVVALLVPTTLLVLVTGRRRRRRHAPARPVALVVLAALVLGLLAAGLSVVADADPAQTVLVGALVAVSVLVWTPVGRQWAVRGLAAWALTVTAGLAYLAYTATWSATAGLGPFLLVGSALLWLVEAFVFVVGLGHLWEFIDTLTRRSWPAAIDPRHLPRTPGRPFVSLHVPTHNEPPEMVIATLQQLLRQEYDDYEILLIDNNTTDEALWRPLEAFCAAHDRITFLHVERLAGFKSGALNLALGYTDPRTEVIGIVDADYLVRPDFLADCAPMFNDPTLSFLQTPQDYRGKDVSSYFRRLYYSYGYFFDVSQVSRNELNGAIFGGTMGLLRRSALEAAGGWDEWCITEDAEMSLRLLRDGGRGIHVDRSYGQGVMPLTFEALKRQRFRWCFGGVQILRMHWRTLLPGPRTSRNQLTLGQRWAYLVGGLQWFGDLASLLFTGFLLLGALDAVTGSGLVIRRLSGVLLLCVVTVVFLGLSRAVVLTRRSTGARWTDAAGAFGLWLALGWVVAVADVRGLFAREGVFLRTPKQGGDLRVSYALRANLVELVLGTGAVVVGAVAVAHQTLPAVVVGVLLALQGVGYLLAPVNSIAAIRSQLPDDLARRRRFSVAARGTVRRGGALVAVGAAVVVAMVAVAGPDEHAPVPGAVAALDPTDTITAAPHPTGHGHGGNGARPAGRGAGAGGDGASGVAATHPAGTGAGGVSGGAASVPATGSATSPTAAPTTVATAAPTSAPRPTTTATASPTTGPGPGRGSSPTTAPTQASKPTSRPTTAATSRPTSPGKGNGKG